MKCHPTPINGRTGRLQHILLDLDGTLSDPSTGIARSLAHALGELGVHMPDMETVRSCIGPPLQESFSRLLDTQNPEQIREAIALYRSVYSTVGLYENTIYPGVPDMLTVLEKHGFSLYLVTSKPMPYASRILEHFGIASRFEKIFGSSLDGGNIEKSVLIQTALRDQRIEPQQAVMIGDRKHDIQGARENSVESIGVTWGFGSLDELIEASPRCIVERPEEIPPLLETW